MKSLLVSSSVAFSLSLVLLSPIFLSASSSVSAQTPAEIHDGGPIDLTGAISVKAYGARGDGITDDTAALRAAARAASGKTLLIDPGTYLMSGMTLNGPTKVYAQGATFTLKACAGEDCFNSPGLLIQKTALVDGIAVEGNGTQRTGIVIRGNAGTKVRNCMLNNIDSADAARSPGSLLVDNASDFLVIGCMIKNSKVDGIDILGSHAGTIHNNTIRAAVRHGITLWDGDAASTRSADARNVYDIIISHNTVSNVMGGIWASRGDQISISTNYVENCRDVCIDYEGTINSVAKYNRVMNANNGGLTIFYGARNIEFSHNEVRQELGYGHGIMIYGNGWSENVRFIENFVTTENTSPFFATESVYRNSLVQANHLTSKGGAAGIQINRGGSNRIIGNNINVGDYHTGIFIQGANSANIVEGNIIKAAAQPVNDQPRNIGGIHLYWSSAQWPTQSNIVRNNTLDGFYVSINDNAWADRTSLNTIDGNRVVEIFRPCGLGYRGIIRNNTHLTTRAAAVGACF